MQKIRKYLDSITMYRVVLYALSALVGISLLFSAVGWLTYASFGTLALTLLLLSAVCYPTNQLLSKLYGIPSNLESSAITAFILYFVLGAPDKPVEWVGVALAGIIAMASKYVITWRGSHIFNPAAFGVLVVSLLSIGSGAWWIANESLFFPMLLVVFVVLIKLRRFELFFAFLVTALAVMVLNNPSGQPLFDVLKTGITLFPLLFLGSIMLTEPATMPNTRYMRILFGVIVGFALAYNVGIGILAASPHLALLIGNLFALLVSARAGAYLKLINKTQLTPTTYEFTFQPSRPITHKAGQYMEFTLPYDKSADTRGNRRTFTIASAPSDKNIRIGVKFFDNGSSFKKKLQSLKIGDTIMGGHVAGDFILPNDTKIPVVFVAGGIGVTPFIAMLDDVIASKASRTIDLYYFANDQTEIAYEELLDRAKKAGVTIHSKLGKESRLSAEEVQAHPSAHFYLSGPPGMVAAYKSQLSKQNVAKIHTDLFTGY